MLVFRLLGIGATVLVVVVVIAAAGGPFGSALTLGELVKVQCFVVASELARVHLMNSLPTETSGVGQSSKPSGQLVAQVLEYRSDLNSVGWMRTDMN